MENVPGFVWVILGLAAGIFFVIGLIDGWYDDREDD